LGELEAPSIWRLQYREDPKKHVIVIATKSESEADFYQNVTARASESNGKQVLVFVHGFNQTFEDATRRTAQIAYDLAFDGPSIAFSWPSQGSVLDYVKDQRNADISAQALQTFLMRLKGSSKHLTVHLIAHSMGNRVLARALEQMGGLAQIANNRPLTEVAMMAPDVDEGLFRQIAGKVSATARRVTLYASSNDNALQAAKQLAGYPRAGDAGPNIVVVAGIQTVDASAVQTSALGLGHSYYADNSTVLSDLFGLIRGRAPSERFGLIETRVPAGPYWRFRPAVN
jgi:esterase/lipase superfamily enzyme